MPLPRRRFLRFASGFAGLAAATAVSRNAAAQAYPDRPVRWIVPFPAGGSTDIATRIICDWLSKRLGQQFIVENKPGGGTNIGTEAVAHAAPDGYTLAARAHYQRDQSFALQIAAVRLPARHRAGGGRRGAASGVRSQSGSACQDGRRVHSLRKGQSRQDQFRFVRRPHHQPSRHRAVQEFGRDRRGARALPGRSADADRHDQRPRAGRRSMRCPIHCRTSRTAAYARLPSCRRIASRLCRMCRP